VPVGNQPSPFFQALIGLGVAQTKNPELAGDCKGPHCPTNSKFACSLIVRTTPMGLPVQWTIPFVHVQVSGAQLTLTKCSWPRASHQCPAPPLKAFGRGLAACRR